MKYISRTVNISNFKSYIDSLVPSCNKNEIVDIRDKNYQNRLNTTSNYSMCPLTVKVTIDSDVVNFWAWDTLHSLYKFFETTNLYCLEKDEENDVLLWLGKPKSFLQEHFSDIKNSILNYVKTGYSNENDFIKFEVVDNLNPFGGCVSEINYNCYIDERKDKNGFYKDRLKEHEVYRDDHEHIDDIQCYTSISIPLNITNNIDNVGLMDNLPEEWQEQTPYTIGDIVFYDNKDWYLESSVSEATGKLLNPQEVFKSGYTWDKTFMESIFGNLYYDQNSEEYKTMPSTVRPWVRNIEHEMKTRQISDGTVIVDGAEFSSYLGEYYLKSGENIYYAYKNNKFIPNPTNKDISESYELIQVKNNFIIYNNEVKEIKDYLVVKNFNCDKQYCQVYENCNYVYIDYNGQKIYGYRDKDGETESNPKFEYNGEVWESEYAYGMFINGIFVEMSENDVFYTTGYISQDGVISSNAYYGIIKGSESNAYYVILDNIVYVVVKNENPYYELWEYNVMTEEIETYTNFLLSVTKYGENFNDPNSGFKFKEDKATFDNEINKRQGYYIDVDGCIFYISKPYSLNVLNYVTGTSESHISMFANGHTITDELGKKIDGIVLPLACNNPLEPMGEYSRIKDEITSFKPGVLRPLPNRSLSLNYIPNSVRYLEKVESNDNEIKYFGNILTNVDFYIVVNDKTYDVSEVLNDISNIPWNKLTSGEKLDYIFNELTFKVDNDDDFNYILIKNTDLTPSDRVIDSTLNFEELLDTLGGHVRCVFKYYLGTFIKYDKETDEYSIYPNSHKGVEYTEEYKITRYLTVYNRSVNDGYTIYTYSMEPEDFIISDDGFNTNIIVAKYKMEIPVFSIKNLSDKTVSVHSGSTYSIEEKNNLDNDKGFISSPIIHRDFNNGMAFQEKVSGDIYIDRGISAAFEKFLKLQEISTMNDLENYSNGGFFNLVNDK